MFLAPKPPLTRVGVGSPQRLGRTRRRPPPTWLTRIPTPTGSRCYRDNVERLYRLMYARVGNRADAEDLASEVFLHGPRAAQAGLVER